MAKLLCKITYLLPVLWLTFSAWAQNNSIIKLYCDCSYSTVVERESYTQIEEKCSGQNFSGIEDVGFAIDSCNADKTRCTCHALYGVYGFGENRESAKNNAELTCQSVSIQSGRSYRLLRDECKVEN